MKTIEEMDKELDLAVEEQMVWAEDVLRDQRNEVVAERDEAMRVLRDIVDLTHEYIQTSLLQRARELLKRKEGQ